MIDEQFEGAHDPIEEPTAALPTELGAEAPLSRADLEAFAHQVASWLPRQPEPTEDPYMQQIEDRITNRVQQVLQQTLGPIQMRQAMEQLAVGHDPSAISEYTEGLTPQELQFMASHPGLKRMAQDALRGRQSAPVQALRATEAFDGDGPTSGAEDERAKWRGLASVFGGDAVQKLISQRRGR